MNNFKLVFLALLTTVAIVGCDDAEKKADKINGQIKTAESNATDGESEYRQAVYLYQYANTQEQLRDTRAKFLSAKEKLTASKESYQAALQTHDKSRDEVKLKGRENIQNNIQVINRYLENIEKYLNRIDRTLNTQKDRNEGRGERFND